MCPYSPLSALCCLSLLLPAWAASQVIATGWTWSAAAMRATCRPPSSPLLRLHVRTLRLNRNAGRMPRYAPRETRLRLVRPGFEGC